MTTLTGRVTRTAVTALCGTLLAVGLATAGLLHARARYSLDQALLAAAFAEAHPWQEERFENDYVRSPVQVRPWRAGDPVVSEALYDQAVSQELPLLRTLDSHRVLLLVVEPEGPGASDRSEDHPHFVVVAEAPAVSVWDVALPFLGIYGVVGILAILAAALAIRTGMQRALQPLYRAADDLEAVRGLGSQARLQRGGPAEVDQLLASANALLERLDAAFDAQAGFTAQAAHELRTPVTVLKGELELALRRERDAPSYRQALQRASVEVDRLVDLVEGLMLLTRVEAGHADRGRETERLSQIVHQAVERERGALEAAGCPLDVDLTADPEVTVHTTLVATAIANLLRNAATHASGAKVSVRVGRSEGCAAVTVEDTGPGLSSEDRRRVLERFQRGSRRDGLGLGLPLAREIARRHGGDLRLEPADPHGLRAVLLLPESDF